MKDFHINNFEEDKKLRLLFLSILSMSLLGMIVYSNILHAPFAFDDYSSIVDNETIKNIKTSFDDFPNNRYFANLSFAVNYLIGELKPFGYHLINNFIHIINTILIYYLVILTFRTPFFSYQPSANSSESRVYDYQQSSNSPFFIAFSAAFIFVSHPIQTQAVTYIAQRATSMAAMFYLLSLVMYIKWRLGMQSTEYRTQSTDDKASCHSCPVSEYGINSSRNPGTKNWIPVSTGMTDMASKRLYNIFGLSSVFWYLGSVIFAILAMKTKEIAFTLPFIIALYEFSFFNKFPNAERRTPNLKRFVYLLPILLTLLIIPFSMLNLKAPVETITQDIDLASKETLNTTRTDYLFTQFRVIVTYIRLLVLPINQSLDYSYPVYKSFFSAQVFFSFLLLVMLFGTGVYFFYRSRFTVHSSRFSNSRLTPHALRLIAFGIFWFFITLSVESSIIPIRDVIAEHRLYLPSIGFFIALITLLAYFISKTNIKIVLVVVIVVILSIGTYHRNTVWKYPQTLWEDVLAKFPNNVRAYNGLGVILKNQGEYDKAIEQFEKILKINPNYVPAYYNFGDIQYKLGNYENAAAYFKKALTLKPSHSFYLDTLNSLAITYSKMGDNDNAVNIFKEAIRLYPSSVIPYNNLGRQYIEMGKYNEAVEIIEKGLKIREEPHLRYNLSVAYAEQKKQMRKLSR